MRKIKCYFGKNKGVSQFGRKDGKFGVPQLLRSYFKLQLSRHYELQQRKMSINSSYGSYAVVNHPIAYETMLHQRKELKRKFLSGNF